MVYFILDLKHFLRRGTIERLQQELCWLPTWEQARELLKEHGVSDATVSDRLEEQDAILKGQERLCLYQLLEEAIVSQTQSAEMVSLK